MFFFITNYFECNTLDAKKELVEARYRGKIEQ